MLRENESPAARERGRAGNGKACWTINDSKRSDRRQREIVAAIERCDDLLALWKERRRLEHRLRLARLRFEFVDCTRTDEFAEIAAEVADWGNLVRAFAKSRRAA